MKPSPLHSGHAPSGLLNENILGSSSSMLTPCSGHARLVLKVFSSGPSPLSTITCTSPSPWAIASSHASASLLWTPSLTFILSTTISIVCLNVFSELYLVLISQDPDLTVDPALCVNPSLRILSSIFSCVSFLLSYHRRQDHCQFRSLAFQFHQEYRLSDL